MIVNNLQPVRKILKHILNMRGTLFVTQKLRLKEDHTGDSNKGSHSGLEKDHTRNSKKGSLSEFFGASPLTISWNQNFFSTLNLKTYKIFVKF